MIEKTDRFHVEQEIMNCWQIVDELGTLLDAIDKDATEDQIANIIIGLKDLYNFKFEKLYEKFSELIVTNNITPR